MLHGTAGRRINLGLTTKLTVSAALLAALFFLSDVSSTLNVMARVSPPLFGSAALAITAYVVLGASRWWLILRCNESQVDLVRLCHINFVASFLGQALPAGVGVDGVRVLMLRARGVGTSRALAAAALDRAFLFAVLLAVSGFAFLGDASGPNIYLVGAVLLLVSPLPIAALLTLTWLNRVPFLPTRIAHVADCIVGHARGMLSRPVALMGLLSLSILSVANLAFCASLIARGLELEIGFADMWLILPPALLATALPISFGGWGIREVTLVAGLAQIGVPQANGLALSLLFGIANIIGTLPGLPLWLTGERAVSQDPSVQMP